MVPSDEEDYHYRMKIVVLGDTKSGKTTFLDSKFIIKIALTQNNGKIIEIETSEEISERISLTIYDHLLYRLTFWEIPGKERNIKYLNHYCMDAAVAIVLFDTTKNTSLEKASKILEQIQLCDIPFKILVANKIDLLTTKRVSDPVLQKEAEILAKNAGATYYTCK
jgi:small GTP-binding protein